jgi:hypothetical protein
MVESRIMRAPRTLVIASILALCSAAAAAMASAAESGRDLDLVRREEVAAGPEAPFRDPHDMACSDCHEPDPSGGKAGPLKQAEDPDRLCLACHPSSNLHPVGIPAAATTELRAQVTLPLGGGMRKGTIICGTCHALHGKELRPGLLRLPEGGRGRRQTLCAECHGSRLTEKSPHRKDAGSCALCHTAPPREGAASLSLSVQQTCDFCHDALGQDHFLALNPFSDPALAGSLSLPELPRPGGRFTCATCHDPHRGERDEHGRRTHLLRPAYLRLAARSNKINPHWKDVMCFSCHAGEPEKGKSALLTSGDLNALCNRCHEGRFARREIHPVNVAPSDKVVIPAGYPLERGLLTCETCHDSSMQEGGERFASAGRDNPKFLREGITTRNEFCLRCHLVEHYGALSAHDQLTAAGSIREQSCLFCHSSLPDRKVPGIETVYGDEVDLDAYCTVCHNRHAGKHPTAVHLVEPSRRMARAIESAPDRIGYALPLHGGRVICATCHNPHQAGVLSGEAREVTTGTKRLRLNEGRTICMACHLEK